MSDHLTGEQIRHAVEEINAIHHQHSPEQWEAGMWRIRRIEHLYSLPVEAYIVVYTDGLETVYLRAEWGNLITAPTWSYQSSDDFEDTHSPESEAQI